jgi:hypothetical protein
MIVLPPGCKVNREIQIDVHKLTDEIADWFVLIGGSVNETKKWTAKGQQVVVKQVKYGQAKESYTRQDGTGNTIIRFAGVDASVASMFLLKFMEDVHSHNLKEVETYVY